MDQTIPIYSVECVDLEIISQAENALRRFVR